MRISDWSSDVCSSDLGVGCDSKSHCTGRKYQQRRLDQRYRGVCRGTLNNRQPRLRGTVTYKEYGEMFDLTGMTALVTGATGGIGSAIAKALATQGATLALSGTSEEKLAAFKAERGGGQAIKNGIEEGR